jgi:ATP-dependent DNA helicase RecG
MMAIPITIHQLLESSVVESARIEYKKAWNPQAVLHTLCAFANDIDNWGGGYIVIGLSETNGQPILPPTGLPAESLDSTMKELLQISKLIKPEYLPICEPVTYEGRNLLLIWAPGGYDRPYDCPESLSQNAGRSSYIRKMSNTIKASRKDVQELHDIGSNIPYDDRLNLQAEPNDLKINLIRSFLTETNSALLVNLENRSLEEVSLDMRILDGPQENLKPLNVGLMFFNYHPEKYFRYAWIEIVYLPNPTGTGMIERTFKGPLNEQLVQALQYIENSFIAEKIIKIEDRAESIRIFNYPFNAVEELLTNAVFHKSYQIPEPVVVRITPQKIVITSFPGPEKSITDEDIKRGVLMGRRYRNRRIGDFLKELRLVEGRNTGIPTAANALQLNGSPPAKFQTDEDRSFFEVTLQIHPAFESTQTHEPAPAEQGKRKRRTREGMEQDILLLLSENGELSTNEVAKKLGYRSISATLSEVVSDMIQRQLIEYSQPEQMTSPKQTIKLKNKH